VAEGFSCVNQSDCDDGQLCSPNNVCGISCDDSSDCHNCNNACVGNICGNKLPFSILSRSSFFLYLGKLYCSLNDQLQYCYPLIDDVLALTCEDVKTAGCCSGLMSQYVLSCINDPVEAAHVRMLQATCQGIDWTDTCGFAHPADCCGPNAACDPVISSSCFIHLPLWKTFYVLFFIFIINFL